MDRLDRINLFIQICRLGSMSAAAEQMGLSRPVVSKAVQALEADMGVPLLARTTRSLAPTEAGRILIESGSALLAGEENLRAHLQRHREQPMGRLRISAPSSFNNDFLATLINAYVKAAPEVYLDIVLSDDFVDLVTDGFDVALRISDLPDSGLIARKVRDMRIITLASPDYLSRHGHPNHPAELQNHICIEDSNERHSSRWPFQEAGRPFRVPIKSRARMNSPHLTLSLALRGEAIIRSPEFAARKALDEGRVIALLENYELPGAGLYIVYPDKKNIPRKLSIFIETALKTLCPG